MAKSDVEKLEAGNIYFFYRPDVEEQEPKEFADIQRLYLVLAPDDSDKFRISVIGKKRLPDPSTSGERIWGFVQTVTSGVQTVQRELGEITYQTKTRGTRHQPAARPVGEGRYQVVTHGDHTHLVYDLELPRKLGQAQDIFQIEDQASYIISIKNPEKGSPPSAGLQRKRKADYPKTLQQAFGSRRFINADPPKFLDYEGCEFVLISTAEDIEELGISLDTERETLEESDIKQQLHLDTKKRPVEPLLTGELK